jgi:hypothetical protein
MKLKKRQKEGKKGGYFKSTFIVHVPLHSGSSSFLIAFGVAFCPSLWKLIGRVLLGYIPSGLGCDTQGCHKYVFALFLCFLGVFEIPAFFALFLPFFQLHYVFLAKMAQKSLKIVIFGQQNASNDYF